MSEQRSWDSRRSPSLPTYCNAAASTFGKPVRIVEWQDGWPPQSEVPHAGTRWVYDGRTFTVHSGIPVIDTTGSPCLVCHDDARGRLLVNIHKLKPIPPKPETVTGEVVASVRVKRYPTPGELDEDADRTLIIRTDRLPVGPYKLVKVDP